MRYNDLIQLYFERSGALQTLWTLYVVIVGGLLAFSSLRKAPDRITTILVSVLFGVFAFQNLGGLRDAAIQRLAVLQTIKRVDAAGPDTAGNQAEREIFEPTLLPVSYTNIKTVHVISDTLTLLALWAMELRRRKAMPTGEKR